jgi:hypothetical protein
MDLRIILLLLIGANVLKVSKTSHSGCQLYQNCDKVSKNFENTNVDTIFVGKIVHFFPPKERGKRKNGKNKRKQQRICDNSILGKRKCYKMKNAPALIEVKKIYKGEKQAEDNQYFIVEGLLNAERIGETKLFLSKKLYEGVFEAVDTILPNTNEIQRVESAQQQHQVSAFRKNSSKGKFFIFCNNLNFILLYWGIIKWTCNSYRW